MEKSTFKPALQLTLGKLLASAATFLIPVVLVRVFDQTEFGTYKQIFLIYSTLWAVAQIGMAESLFYFLPLAPEKAGKYVWNSTLSLVVSGLACLAILESQATRIGAWLSNPALARYLGLLGVYLLLMLASTGLEIVMIARRTYLRASACYALADMARTALFLLPLILEQRLHGVLLGGVVFAALRLCAAAFYFRREFRSDLKADGAALREQMAYALPFEMAVVVEILQINLPHYAVAHRFDAATFAIYSVGCLQFPLVDFIATSVGNVMMVGMGEEIREGRKGAALAMFHDGTLKLALIFFPLATTMVLSAREIIGLLFTRSYAASVPIFRLWSLMILLSALQTDAVMRVYADTRVLFGLKTVRLLLTALFVGWFLSSFHLAGAVLVALAAAAVAKGLALVRIKNLMGVRFSQVLPWHSLLTILGCSALAGVPAMAVSWRAGWPALPLYFVTGLVYTVAYLALLVWSGHLNVREVLGMKTQLLRSPAAAAAAGELKTG